MKKILFADKAIIIITFLLMFFGIIFVFSSSFAIAQAKFGEYQFFLYRHIIRVILAIISFLFFINIDYHIFEKISRQVYIIAIVLLVYVLIAPSSYAVKGAKRWISLGFVTFQVSELARIFLIVYLAAALSKDNSAISEWKSFVRYLAYSGIICGLIVLEPDLSTAVLTGMVALAMIFVAGAKVGHVLLVFISFIPVSLVAIISTPYRLKRLIAFFNMGEMKKSIGYQTYQALIGLGSGGIFGKGIGMGEQKYFFLPEPHTDFVFAVLGEEIGFVGLIIISLMFLFLIYRCVKVSLNAPDKFGHFLSFGLTVVIAFYFIIHTLVNTGLIPTTGVPLPFLSYGGMSLIFNMSAIGIILNVSTHKSGNGGVNSTSRMILE